MKTNGGSRVIEEEADEPIMDVKVHYDRNAITNLYALCNIVKKGRVYYDSDVEDAFFVEVKRPGNTNKLLKFEANQEGLYVLQNPCGECHTEMEGFGRREIERAKRARRLYHQLKAPSEKDFKSILRQNIIRNCLVEEKDIDLAHRIFGKDVPTLKGQSTRPKPNVVVDTEIEVPEEFLDKMTKDLELAIDLVFINSQIFMTTIDRTITFKAVVPLRSREDEVILEALDVIISYYRNTGFDVMRIHADGEFESLKERIRD